MGPRSVPLVALTRGAMPEVGAGGVPVHAPIRGLAKVLAAERPDAQVRVVDVGDGVAPEAVVEAVLSESREPEIALRAEGALVPRLEAHPARFVTETVHLDPDAAYVLTEGTGGLGLAFARWLASRGARHLVLLARRPPSEEAREAIARLERLGVDVRCEAVDVADEEALRAVWSRIGRPVRGVIHGAGVLADAVLENQDRARLDLAFRPKIGGVWALHRVLGDEPLDFFVSCSSIAALLGSPGQGAYAAANAFLDAFAAWRPEAKATWWGPWAKVGMAARQGERERAALVRSGLTPLEPEVAVEALEQVLAADGQLAVARLDPDRLRLSSPLLAHVTSGTADQAEPALVLELRRTPEHAIERVTDHVVRLLTEISGAPLDADRSIQALGMDSLMALDAQARIKAELGVEVHVTRFLRDSSVAELAAELTAELLGEAPAAPASPAAPPAEVDVTPAPSEPAPPPPVALPQDQGFDLGLFFFSRDAEGGGDGYALLQEAVKRADRAGLGAVWLPERHFHAFGGLYPNPSVLAASLASITERIRLRSGSVVLPLHHPARVAEEWAVVDRLSGGRVDLAAGGRTTSRSSPAPSSVARRSSRRASTRCAGSGEVRR